MHLDELSLYILHANLHQDHLPDSCFTGLSKIFLGSNNLSFDLPVIFGF
jgi:hypothetical protein